MRKSSRLKSNSLLNTIQLDRYINVINDINLPSRPMSYWQVMLDMDDARRKYKLLKQKGGSCVIFSIETAKQIAQRNMNPREVECSAKIKKDGSQMKNHLKRLGVKASDYKSAESYEKNQEQTKHYDLLTDIIQALNKNYVVVAGGNPDLPYDTEYKVNNKKTMVPIFNYKKTPAAHNICIIGCYEDIYYGPCFLTKMTNERGPYYIPLKDKNTNFLSYGLLPIKYLQGETKIRLVEFAKLKVKSKLKF